MRATSRRLVSSRNRSIIRVLQWLASGILGGLVGGSLRGIFGVLSLGANAQTSPSIVGLLTVSAVIVGTCLWAVPLALALTDVLSEGLGWKTSHGSPMALAAASLLAYLMTFLPWQILDLFTNSANFGPLGREFTVAVWGWESSAAWLIAFATSAWVMLARPVVLRV